MTFFRDASRPSMSRKARQLVFFLTLMLPAVPMHAAEGASLFQRIGGEPVMKRVVDQMVATMVLDSDVAATLRGVDLARFSRNLYIHMCATTGGPCDYKGEDMRTVHAGMHISAAQLDVASAALANALDANGVGEREKRELLTLRAPMRREVMEP